jgi:chaperonin GroES
MAEELKQRLIRKTSLGAQYVTSRYEGKNTSGLEPISDLVLVLPDESVEKTAGGVYLSQETQYAHQQAAETGVIVAAGPGAWLYTADRAQAFQGRKPQAGDRVYFQRYAGQIVIGEDGYQYHLMTDKAIAAVNVGAAAGGAASEPKKRKQA